MKKITLLVIFSLLAHLSPAQNIELFPFSTAATDNLFAAKINPAALSFGNAGGFGMLINNDFLDHQEEFSLFFNFTNLAYILEQNKDNFFHTVALSQKIIKNLYLVSGEKTIYEVLSEIEELSKEKWLKGIIFVNYNFQTSYAGLLEIEEALQAFKATGKKLVFYFEQADKLNYILAASVADKIYLHPQGSVNLSGFSTSQPYLKDLLAELGIEVINFRSHNYKTAGNMFSESSMTKEEREALEELFEVFHKQAVTMINVGR